jgi:hypothetical protein
MDNAQQIKTTFNVLKELMPGYVFTMMELLMLRQLQGDGVYQELEALLKGLEEDGEMESEAFEAALTLVDEMPLGDPVE